MAPRLRVPGRWRNEKSRSKAAGYRLDSSSLILRIFPAKANTYFLYVYTCITNNYTAITNVTYCYQILAGEEKTAPGNKLRRCSIFRMETKHRHDAYAFMVPSG